MNSSLLKPALYLAALGMMVSSFALVRADSLTVEGDLPMLSQLKSLKVNWSDCGDSG
jgi:hypothetical protein